MQLVSRPNPGRPPRLPIDTPSHLHDPVPVVTGGDAEEREEGHAERAEVRVLPEALAGMVLVAACNVRGKTDFFRLTMRPSSRVPMGKGRTYPIGQTFPRPRRQR